MAVVSALGGLLAAALALLVAVAALALSVAYLFRHQ